LPAWALEEPSRGVWLIPTREFQERTCAERQLAPGVAALYRLYTEVVAQEAREHGARVLTIDGAKDIPAVAAEVEDLLDDALATGPHAETHDERSRLLREANLTIVEQVRGYYRRPWATGDPEAVQRDFLCECGNSACLEVVLATLAQAASAPVLAPSHDG
jgi:hypothetical protein